jgi:transketolase
VEAGVTRWWGQYGCRAALGVDRFGESAPAPDVCQHLGLTAGTLADRVEGECAELGAVGTGG